MKGRITTNAVERLPGGNRKENQMATQRQKLMGEIAWSAEMYLRANLRYFGNGKSDGWDPDVVQHPIHVNKLPTFQAACAMVALRDWVQDGGSIVRARGAMEDIDHAFHEYESRLAFTYDQRVKRFSEVIDRTMRGILSK